MPAQQSSRAQENLIRERFRRRSVRQMSLARLAQSECKTPLPGGSVWETPSIRSAMIDRLLSADGGYSACRLTLRESFAAGNQNPKMTWLGRAKARANHTWASPLSSHGAASVLASLYRLIAGMFGLPKEVRVDERRESRCGLQCLGCNFRAIFLSQWNWALVPKLPRPFV